MLPDSFTPALLRQLELFKIRSRRAFLGSRQGGHVSLKRGHGIEFSDYRRYELGDNPRHIDWGVYARSDRLFVKTFQEEQDLAVLVLIDSSASMFTPASDNKWERARDIALALGYVALMEQDTTSVAVPGVLQTPFYHGVRAIHDLSAALMNVQGPTTTNFLQEAQKAVSRVRFPGVAIFISDFLMPLTEVGTVLNFMRAKNLDITAVQVLGPNDINPLSDGGNVIAVDSETGQEIDLLLDSRQREEYSAILEEHNKKLRQLLSSAGIRYTQVDTGSSLADAVVRNLPATGLLR